MLCFKRKSKSEPHINPALVPSAAFTIVPRTPAPVTPRGAALEGSLEVLNSSLLGRQPPRDSGPDEEPFSDPESSLYDYQNMEDAGYSSVEMLSVSRKRRSRGNREHDIEEHQQAQMAGVLSSPGPQQNSEALYSMPVKRGQRQSSSQTLDTTIEVHDAMRRVHDQSSEDEGRAQDKPHRPTRKQPSARSLHFPVEHEITIKERHIRSSASTPAETHKSQKSRGSHIEEQIVRNEVVVASNSSPPQLDMDAADGPDTVRSRSLSGRSVVKETERLRSLEAEREHLATLTHQLENEVQTYREVVSTYETGDPASAASMLAQKQISDLKEENESLKNSIKRLHVELSSYQAKYRPPNGVKQGEMSGLPSEGPPPSWLFNIRYLNPLFLAYDDRIREREDTIRKCQADLEALRLRTEAIVKENERLHSRLENTPNGPVDLLEWEQMKDNARLVLEENQNLLEQISVKDQKTHDLHQAHLREVGKLSKQVSTLKTEKEEVTKELEDLKASHRTLKLAHDRLVTESQGHITQEQHIKEVADLKKKMTEQEDSHRRDLDAAQAKLQGAIVERKSLGNQVIELTTERKRHQIEARLMHKSVRHAQQRMMLLQRAIEQSANKEMSVQEYLSSLIKVAEKSAFERDTYEKVAKEHEIETKKAMKKLLQGSLTVGKMEEKLKLYKMRAAARIGTVAERMKEQEEVFNSQKREYEREISHLRNIIREKEDLIQEAAVDKRDLEEQMEAVWQSANSENVRIREDMHRSVQQLRKHTGLSEALDEQEKLEKVYVSSDDEADVKAVAKT
ncbi:centrosomal protein of 89 kDa-like isoform X2 [Dreissena polymorpha]|uniref:centrosomal protein of 89 kDa-like isoform X2 n=1 Tax=Dreissena polymorpha TaxID=45954 RepID=UPI002263ED6F|nr:centrosomal protein of 89 kDa-like isoform X2 [Dreissena polymorpha]